MNTEALPLTLRAETVLGICTPVDVGDIHDGRQPKSSVTSTIPAGFEPHVEPLFQQAQQNCANPQQKPLLSQLLQEYADVFSKDETDVNQETWARKG